MARRVAASRSRRSARVGWGATRSTISQAASSRRRPVGRPRSSQTTWAEAWAKVRGPSTPASSRAHAAGEHGVGVEEQQEGRNTVEHGVEGGDADGHVPEDVGVQAPAVQPGPRSERAHLACECLAYALDLGAVRQVETVGEFGTGHRVEMSVDQPRGDHGSLKVDHRGRGVRERADVPVVAERRDPASGRGEGGLRKESAGDRVEQTG